MSSAPSSAKQKSAKGRVGRPPGSNKEDTLAKILPAARQQFAEKGFAQTTFKDIGKQVGMTHAALYQYFSSKAELYLATLVDTQALLLPDYLEAINRGETLKQRISGVLLASADAHDRDSTITGFLAAVPIEMRRHKELGDSLLSQNNVVIDALEAMFQDAMDSGEIVIESTPRALVTAFLGGGVGVQLFQYGMSTGSMRDAMEVFVALIESRIFAAAE